MGVSERREREKQEIRSKIVDAARELFAKEGYDAVTMRRIADAIEYSPTAIYFHFKDKEALIRELCSQDFLTLAKSFQRIAKEPDPVERVRKIGMAYVEFGLTHPNHYRLMFMAGHPEEAHDEEELARVGNPEQDAYAFVRATVGQAIAEGRFHADAKDVDLVSQALWAAVHGVVSLHIAMAVPDDPFIDWKPARKTAQLVVDALVRGLETSGGVA